MADRKSFPGPGVIVTIPNGYIVKDDAKVFEFNNSDRKKISFTVVVRRHFGDINKSTNTDADFWEVEYIVNTKNSIDKSLRKGSSVTITGRILKDYWKNDDREKPPMHVKIRATDIAFVSVPGGGKKSNNSEDESFNTDDYSDDGAQWGG